MKLLVTTVFLFVASLYVRAQNDNFGEIKSFVLQWNELLSDNNSSALANLYADEVVFYIKS